MHVRPPINSPIIGRMACNRQLILNRYRPIEEAGAGGFGSVQVAWDTRIQRWVAIKCIELDEVDMARMVFPGCRGCCRRSADRRRRTGRCAPRCPETVAPAGRFP